MALAAPAAHRFVLELSAGQRSYFFYLFAAYLGLQAGLAALAALHFPAKEGLEELEGPGQAGYLVRRLCYTAVFDGYSTGQNRNRNNSCLWGRKRRIGRGGRWKGGCTSHYRP